LSLVDTISHVCGTHYLKKNSIKPMVTFRYSQYVPPSTSPFHGGISNFSGSPTLFSLNRSTYKNGGHAVTQSVEALRYNPEGRGFVSLWCHWTFSLTYSFRSHYGIGGSTQPLTDMSNRSISWGGKGGRCVGLTILQPSCADCLEIWEPQPPGTLRICPGL
jgi:hypothetical protein